MGANVPSSFSPIPRKARSPFFSKGLPGKAFQAMDMDKRPPSSLKAPVDGPEPFDLFNDRGRVGENHDRALRRRNWLRGTRIDKLKDELFLHGLDIEGPRTQPSQGASCSYVVNITGLHISASIIRKGAALSGLSLSGSLRRPPSGPFVRSDQRVFRR